MAQGGLLGNGTKVAYSAASPVTWIEVKQRREVTFPTWQADKVDITTHSVTNKLKRSMAGLIEVGDPSFKVLTDLDPSTDATYSALVDYNKDGTSLWWRFEVPTNRERTLFRGIEFQASVLNFTPETPIDGAQETTFTLSFDGEDIGWDLVAGATEIS